MQNLGSYQGQKYHICICICIIYILILWMIKEGILTSQPGTFAAPKHQQQKDATQHHLQISGDLCNKYNQRYAHAAVKRYQRQRPITNLENNLRSPQKRQNIEFLAGRLFTPFLLVTFRLLCSPYSAAGVYSDLSHRSRGFLKSPRTFLRSPPDQWDVAAQERGGLVFLPHSQSEKYPRRTQRGKRIPEFPSSPKYFIHASEPKRHRFRSHKTFNYSSTYSNEMKCYYL